MAIRPNRLAAFERSICSRKRSIGASEKRLRRVDSIIRLLYRNVYGQHVPFRFLPHG